MSDQKSSIFRQEALDRLSSPERLDRLMQVVIPRNWLTLTALVVLGFSGLIWSIFGNIPITVTGKGVLINPRRVVQFQSHISGQLKSLDVREGHCVKKDEVLATIDPSDTKQQLQQQQDKLAQLKQQRQEATLLRQQRTRRETKTISAEKSSLQQRLRDTESLTPRLRNKELAAIKEQGRSLEQQLRDAQALTPILQTKGLDAIASQRLSLQKRLQDSQELSPVLKQRWQKRQKLQQQGAIAAEQVLLAEQEYRQTRQNISDIEAQLKQLDVGETEAKQRYLNNLSRISEIQAQLQNLRLQEAELQQKYLDNLNRISQLQAQLEEVETRHNRLEQEHTESANNENNQIQEVQQTIARLQKEVADNSAIKSPHDGCIVEISATVGQYANPGTRLGTLQTGGKADEMVSVTYFAVKDGKKIQPGMEILITPETVKRSRFGGIIGKITATSPFPVTSEGAASVVGNPELVQKLMAEGGGKIEAIAQLELDSKTFSGYRWSSSDGPQLPISLGTTTTARVTVEQRTPISFVLPILREWSGS